jgi:hypothetical protein
MEITRDLFLTDSRAPLFAVSVSSRDLTAHRVLTNLTAAEREAVAAALSAAVTALAAGLRGAYARLGEEPGTSSFGCGT